MSVKQFDARVYEYAMGKLMLSYPHLFLNVFHEIIFKFSLPRTKKIWIDY